MENAGAHQRSLVQNFPQGHPLYLNNQLHLAKKDASNFGLHEAGSESRDVAHRQRTRQLRPRRRAHLPRVHGELAAKPSVSDKTDALKQGGCSDSLLPP